MKKELIESVNVVVPKKGSNEGKQMAVINGKYWSLVQPSRQDTHVCLEDVTVDGKQYTNVIGYAQDTRLALDDKIGKITSQEAGYSMALAQLLVR